MNTTTKTMRVWGMSLPELLVAVATIGALASVGYLSLTDYSESTREVKLQNDLRTVNQAVQTFQANGGTISSDLTGAQVLDLLCTTTPAADRDTVVGFGGAFLDARLQAIDTDSDTSGKRAIWNPTATKFEMASNGDGIAEFELGGIRNVVEAQRDSSLQYAHSAGWVWDHRAASDASRIGYAGTIPTDTGTNPRLAAPGSHTMGSLTAPVASKPSGYYDFETEFPLTVTLSDSNPPGTSQIIYTLGDGTWIQYNGEDINIPETYLNTLMAYSISLDPDNYHDSSTMTEEYRTDPPLLFSGSASGEFSNPEGGSDMDYDIDNGDDSSTFEWGTPAFGAPSSLEFTPVPFTDVKEDEEFLIGTLEYFNGTIYSGTGADGVDLDLDLDLQVNVPLATEDINIGFSLINTPNLSGNTADESADFVRLENMTSTFSTSFNGTTYYVHLRFGDSTAHGFTSIDQFHVHEGFSSTGNIYARVTTEPADEEPPTIGLSTSDTTVSGQFDVTVGASEDIIELTASDFAITGGTAVSITGTGDSYTVTIDAASTTVTVSLPADKATDLAGNGNVASNSLSVSYSPPVIDFDDHTISTFGGSGNSGSYNKFEDGKGLKLKDNSWKSINFNYTVTSDTMITFEFKSSIQGEIHGIGLDNNNYTSSGKSFRLYGTQSWGHGTYDNYSGDGNWKTYTIPVGNFFTGSMNRMVFITDHDESPKNGESYYRNVRVYEQP